MSYKEVEGIDENGNSTIFKIEIPSAKEQLKELKQACENHMGTMVYALQEDRFNLIEQALDEGEEAKEVLDIIIKKKVNIAYFYQFISEYRDASYEQYLELRKINGIVFAISQQEILTETEFNKIKECL